MQFSIVAALIYIPQPSARACCLPILRDTSYFCFLVEAFLIGVNNPATLVFYVVWCLTALGLELHSFNFFLVLKCLFLGFSADLVFTKIPM